MSNRFGRRRLVAAVVGVWVAAALVTACGGHHASRSAVRMSVTPAAALVDDAVAVTVRGLAPGATATVSASTRAGDGSVWTSSARFVATAAGQISTAQRSVGGSYTGVDAMGLFEFLAPPAANVSDQYFPFPAAGYVVTLRTSVNGHLVAIGSTRRRFGTSTAITEKKFRPATNGIYGDLFSPTGITGRRPGILRFGGSEGGQYDKDAERLAARGYPTLSLAYFLEPGLPQKLSRVPLEYFGRALAVLRAQPDVDPRHIIVFGMSRGGEAALLVGSHYPNLVSAVVAGVPSSLAQVTPFGTGPAWTWHGKRLVTVPVSSAEDPRSPELYPGAVIPVERIHGPILMDCGTSDRVWVSCQYTSEIDARLKAHHFRYQVTSLRYPDAGHVVGNLARYLPIPTAAMDGQGGTTSANQAGLTDAGTRVLAFLAAQR